MRLGFDLRALQEGFKAHKKRGIGVYTRSLCSRLNNAPVDLSVAPFYDTDFESAEPLSFGAAPLPASNRILSATGKELLKQHLAQHSPLKKFAETENLDRLFFPSHLDVPIFLNAPYIVTAHDMIQSVLTEKYQASVKNRIANYAQVHVLKKAKKIIAISESTKRDVIKYTGRDNADIEVIYNGIEPAFRRLDNPSRSPVNGIELPKRFILNVGGIDWRKNVDLLFQSFYRLADDHPDMNIVITGQIENDPRYKEFSERVEEKGLQSRVITPGYVSQEDLIRLYNLTEAFVYPSIYEGFGLPVLEAMACGAPVITTNQASIPEVAGDAAIMIDPERSIEFCQAVIEVVNNRSLRAKLSAKGVTQAKKFSWDKCAADTFAFLAN